MRALLLYNPSATTTRPAVTDVIAHALSAELKLDVVQTKRRDHAMYLAAGAVHEGYEVIVALGGDGTVNEVLQGIAGTPVKLAMLPGGSTNVWARTLGLPNDAIEATSVVLERLRERRERTVALGWANDRYFGVNCGFGFDAEVVRYVEARHRLKRTVRQASFLYCALLAYASGYARRAGDITVRVNGDEPVIDLRSVVCCNSNPYTFLGPYPAQVCPGAHLEAGLDLTGIGRLGPVALGRVARTALSSPDVGRLGTTRLWHDQPVYELEASSPLPLQVDGDFVGQTRTVHLRSVPRALTLVG